MAFDMAIVIVVLVVDAVVTVFLSPWLYAYC